MSSNLTKAECYAILKVPSNASSDVIKKAFRTLSFQYHPDKVGKQENKIKENTEMFIKAREAFDVLTGKLQPALADNYPRQPSYYTPPARSAYHFYENQSYPRRPKGSANYSYSSYENHCSFRGAYYEPSQYYHHNYPHQSSSEDNRSRRDTSSRYSNNAGTGFLKYKNSESSTRSLDSRRRWRDDGHAVDYKLYEYDIHVDAQYLAADFSQMRMKHDEIWRENHPPFPRGKRFSGSDRSRKP